LRGAAEMRDRPYVQLALACLFRTMSFRVKDCAPVLAIPAIYNHIVLTRQTGLYRRDPRHHKAVGKALA
jgi:hypothetical protein